MSERILRAREVSDLTGLSPTTIWRLEKSGDFPARRRLAANSIGYLASEILAWIESRNPVAREAMA